MKPTYNPAAQTQGATSATAIRSTTARILEPLKAAALQTAKLGRKSPTQTASSPAPVQHAPLHRIIQGECLEMMAKIPDAAIDFICADFPYNISGKGGLTMRHDKIVKADFGEWDKFPTEEAYLDFVFAVCAEYRRILKPNASMVLFF